MSNWKQRLGVGYIVRLLVVGLVAATAFWANNGGDRLLHARFAVCGVGVVAVIIMFAVVFVLAAREARTSRERSTEG
jgi:hypothetical protein